MQFGIVNKIFILFSRHQASPQTELRYNSEFTLLIAVILSAQSTDKAVNKVTQKLFDEYNTAEKILELGEVNLNYCIRTIGLHNSKAKNIIELCKILVNKYKGEVPRDFLSLISLPGVGRKTANVILNCAFKKNVIAVDTHVFRVSKRLGIASGTSVSIVEKELDQNIPEIWKKDAHNWLVLHGRYICTARNPKCQICFLSKYCCYFNLRMKEKNV